MIRGLAGILMAIVVAGSATGPLAAEPARPNVLFISIDDLRPALGCYGDPLAKTPHIDRLAASGRPFLAAYCQQAVCGPSRTAVLTGRLPDNNRVWHNRQRFRLHEPDTITLPQLFIKSGYRAESYGKVFSGNSQEEDPESWSAPGGAQSVGLAKLRRLRLGLGRRQGIRHGSVRRGRRGLPRWQARDDGDRGPGAAPRRAVLPRRGFLQAPPAVQRPAKILGPARSGRVWRG